MTRCCGLIPKQRRWAWLAAFFLTLTVSVPPVMASDEPADEQANANPPTTITTGSGEQYKTTVHRETEGELSAEGLRQVAAHWLPGRQPAPGRRSTRGIYP